MPNQIATGVPYATDDGIRMRGHAIHGGYFDVPLIQRAWVRPQEWGGGELWQGGCIGGLRLPEDFDFVVSLYPWEQYVLGPNTERVEVKMYDSLDQGFEQVEALAQTVVSRLGDGQKVLVHCQAGLNRSGLVAARALTLCGYSGVEAIAHLRSVRCDQVLCNEAFANWVAGIA